MSGLRQDAKNMSSTAGDLSGDQGKMISPEIEQAGLEVVPGHGSDKQVVGNDAPEKEAVFTGGEHTGREKAVAQPLMGSEEQATPSSTQQRSRRICGLKRGIFWALLVAAIVVVALAVGLGAGLGAGGLDDDSDASGSGNSSDSSSPSSSSDPNSTQLAEEFEIGGGLNGTYYSNQGAWNGSGIAVSLQYFASDLQNAPANGGSQVLYYQHYSGEIRWMRLTTRDTWVRGSPESEVVATDAKNSTPIATVNYISNETSIWHVFYIDTENTVRQRTGSNTSSLWSDGSVNNANLKAWDGDLVGLHAVWAGLGSEVPVRLWYASNSTTFEEYLWRTQEDEWEFQQSWMGYNGAAGVGCYSWSNGDWMYASLVNSENNTEFWYKNKTQESQGEDAPWSQANLVLRDVYPATSIRLTSYLCILQLSDPPQLQVSRMTWRGADTSANSREALSLGSEHSVPGTHLWGSTFQDDNDNQTVRLIYQAYGTDITQVTRRLRGADDNWSRANLQIPD